MPIYKTYEKESFRWGIWKADETLEELALLMPHGDVCMQESIQRFSNENRRKEWLAVRVLLSYLSEKEYEIAYCPSGKPYLKDSSCRISVSHTNGYVAVALHPLHEVGIDIERYATRVMKVKERFMRENEYAEGDEIYALLLHWSAKETLFKLLGQEEVDLKEHFQILPFSIGQEGTMKAYEYKTAEKNDYTVFYRLEPEFVLTWSVNY